MQRDRAFVRQEMSTWTALEPASHYMWPLGTRVHISSTVVVTASRNTSYIQTIGVAYKKQMDGPIVPPNFQMSVFQSAHTAGFFFLGGGRAKRTIMRHIQVNCFNSTVKSVQESSVGWRCSPELLSARKKHTHYPPISVAIYGALRHVPRLPTVYFSGNFRAAQTLTFDSEWLLIQ